MTEPQPDEERPARTPRLDFWARVKEHKVLQWCLVVSVHEPLAHNVRHQALRARIEARMAATNLE